MNFLRKVIDNRFLYAQYIALPTSILSIFALVKMINDTDGSSMGIVGLCILLGICCYCLGGFLTALKSSLSIAKWGWLVVPFPFDILTFLLALYVSIVVFLFFPIIPIRKAYKQRMAQQSEATQEVR